MTVVSLTAAEKEKWAVVFKETARRLAQGTFPPELLERAVKLAQ